MLFALLVAGPAGIERAAAQSDAEGDEAAARAHFEAGRLHHNAGRFEDAAREFQRSYDLSGRPQLLYNIFVAYRDANRPREAADALERYLELESDQPNRAALEARLARLRERLDEEGAAPGRPGEPGRSAPGGGEPPVGAIVTMSAGGLLLAGAVVTGVLALDAEAALDAQCPSRTECDPALASTRDEAWSLGVATDVLWIGGAVVAGAGLVWLLVEVTSGADAPEPAVSLGCDGAGCGAVYRSVF